MTCCPFFGGAEGHPPYLVLGLVIFSFIGILVMIGKINKLIKLLDKK